MHDEYDLTVDEVLDRLDGVVPRGPREWVAKCPAHDDKNPSLSIVEVDEGFLIHCFAGCTYHDVMEAIVDRPVVEDSVVIKFTGSLKDTSKSGLGLFADLFQFSPADLDHFFVGGIDRHLNIKPDRIEFLWPGIESAVKYRLSNPTDEKGYLWAKGSSKPPIWPEIEELLDEEVYITEGESDCIVLRHIGLQAYAVTTGGSRSATPRFPSSVIKTMIDRGVKTIYLAFDDDETGHNTASVVYNQILTLERGLPPDQVIDVRILPIATIALGYLGEKDLRQIWLRIRDAEAFSDEILALKREADTDEPKDRLWPHDEYLQRPADVLSWVVQDVVRAGGLGWISGYPKMGKSFIALDLAFAIATGDPFLGKFPIIEQGDVVYVIKENSDASTMSRIQKILSSKRNGAVVTFKNGASMDFDTPYRVMIDASREFRFEPQQVEALIQKILRHKRVTGRDVKAIIIDPLSFSLPGGRFDLNTFTDFQTRIVDLMAHMTRRTRASVIVVHHQNKSDDNNTMLGSVAAEASYDDKIQFITKGRSLADHRPGDPVRIQIVHRDGQSVMFDLQLDITDTSYKTTVTEVDEYESGSSGGEAKIKLSYGDRMKRLGTMVEPLLSELPEEFTWNDFVGGVRETYSKDDISDTNLASLFTWLRQPGDRPPFIEQHTRGKYRIFRGPQG